MDPLVQAGKLLAEGAILDALARDGDAGKIAEAQRELAAGEVHRAAGGYKEALSRYKDAYAKAQSA